jgi:hypothetical protein
MKDATRNQETLASSGSTGSLGVIKKSRGSFTSKVGADSSMLKSAEKKSKHRMSHLNAAKGDKKHDYETFGGRRRDGTSATNTRSLMFPLLISSVRLGGVKSKKKAAAASKMTP